MEFHSSIPEIIAYWITLPVTMNMATTCDIPTTIQSRTTLSVIVGKGSVFGVP
jgi:hypothetical protein